MDYKWVSVNRHTRAKKKGTLICCPYCRYKNGPIYHFNWTALICDATECRRIINKEQWLVKRKVSRR